MTGLRHGIKPIGPAEMKRIVSLKGTMSAAAAAEISKRSVSAINRVWAKQPRSESDKPARGSQLASRQAVIVSALEAAGDAGLNRNALSGAINRGGFSSKPDMAGGVIAHVNDRLRLLGDPRKIVGSRGVHGYAYRLQLRAPAAPAPVSVPTEPNPNVTVGLHGVSLQRVRCLEGAPA